MSFDIKFDYRFDRQNFFTPERKEILEQAGDIWSSYIRDDFTSIPPGETFKFPINNDEKTVTLNQPVDDLIIFVSSVESNSESLTLGEGAFDADYVVGSDRQTRIEGDDFEPWLGTIEFNANQADKLFFDSTPRTADDIPWDKQDFLSLGLHEVGHVLGIGIAPSFEAQTDKINIKKFTGSQSKKLNSGQPIPLDQDGNHIQDGFTLDADGDALLDKSFTFGERNLPTSLDLAILSDIGYEVSALDRAQVNRFFEYKKGFHFYTADQNEKRVVKERSEAGQMPYKYEGVAYDVLAKDTDILTGEKIDDVAPVYRFFNRQTGAHLYTMDENEKNTIRQNPGSYNFENVAYYAFDSKPQNIETIPLYRMFNIQTGSHFFTTDTNEFNVLSQTQPNFRPEGDLGGVKGVTFYVLESL